MLNRIERSAPFPAPVGNHERLRLLQSASEIRAAIDSKF